MKEMSKSLETCSDRHADNGVQNFHFQSGNESGGAESIFDIPTASVEFPRFAPNFDDLHNSSISLRLRYETWGSHKKGPHVSGDFKKCNYV
jgi:hypothetical protein